MAASYSSSWYPTDVPAVDGVKQFNTPLLDMTVNAYLIWDPETKEAAIFDTGADASELLAFVDSANLTVKYLFLTHTHQDHVADLGAIVKRTHAEIFRRIWNDCRKPKSCAKGTSYVSASCELKQG